MLAVLRHRKFVLAVLCSLLWAFKYLHSIHNNTLRVLTIIQSLITSTKKIGIYAVSIHAYGLLCRDLPVIFKWIVLFPI